MDRSASGVTVLIVIALLLSGLWSGVADVTVALLVSVPAMAGANAVIVIAGAAPTARASRTQATVPGDAWLHAQPVPEALKNVTPTGSASVTRSELAVPGPALLTRSV